MKNLVYISYAVSVLLLGAGIYMIIAPPPIAHEWFGSKGSVPSLPPATVGILVLLYGSFRLWRTRVMHRRMQGHQ